MSTAVTPSAPTLICKLAEIMNEVGRIPKTGYNSFHGYKYVMESDLVEALSEKLAARKVFITSSTKNIETIRLSKPNKKGEIVEQTIGILRVDYTFHDGETGEKLTMESVGEIDQDGGKGLYKALTGSMKYFLMKNFLIATGDDPEQTPQLKQPQPSANVAPQPAPKQDDSSAPATPEQVTEIGRLCKALGGTPQELYAKYNVKTQPTRSLADKMISAMKARLGEVEQEFEDEAKKNS